MNASVSSMNDSVDLMKVSIQNQEEIIKYIKWVMEKDQEEKKKEERKKKKQEKKNEKK